jgi:hypothetical protein
MAATPNLERLHPASGRLHDANQRRTWRCDFKVQLERRRTLCAPRDHFAPSSLHLIMVSGKVVRRRQPSSSSEHFRMLRTRERETTKIFARSGALGYRTHVVRRSAELCAMAPAVPQSHRRQRLESHRRAHHSATTIVAYPASSLRGAALVSLIWSHLTSPEISSPRRAGRMYAARLAARPAHFNNAHAHSTRDGN